MKKFVICFSFLTAFYAGLSHAANIDPSFKFSTIETGHFSIHFHQGLDDAAQKTASIAERVHDTLVKEFRWTPREKTQMVLVDNSDFTHGLANVRRYTTM